MGPRYPPHRCRYFPFAVFGFDAIDTAAGHSLDLSIGSARWYPERRKLQESPHWQECEPRPAAAAVPHCLMKAGPRPLPVVGRYRMWVCAWTRTKWRGGDVTLYLIETTNIRILQFAHRHRLGIALTSHRLGTSCDVHCGRCTLQRRCRKALRATAR